ncbi:lipid-A-disaccharide synthase [Nafulsella turpanensis]|uniref:lipid-A-disaccharide synthase n=1 Tax=Nafulsella turpanensis TaxID=1265690 RepID=UPI000344A238|nr:lipid-A-disaccharide synthase [Nafulsella turpanensis]
MKYFLIAGERSGDLHGSNLIKALQQKDTAASFRGIGGDYMEGAGMQLFVHYKEMAFMGFAEVVQNLPSILGYMRQCKMEIKQFRPDALILIDYAGFNLRIARWAKKEEIKVFYYISPKVWAWNQKRALNIKANVDHMFVIMPFEKEFYARYDYKVDFVGNPLLDAISGFEPDNDFLEKHGLSHKPLIAVLPGSRRQEIENMLAYMLDLIPSFPDYQFVVAGIRNIPQSYYQQALDHPQARVVYDETYSLLAHTHAALVTSGTATLETALFEVPQVVCYKTSWLSYQIAKRLVKVDYISLVNLIAGREVVKELIQDELNQQNLQQELSKIVEGGDRRQYQLKEYKALKAGMGEESASETTAHLILQYLGQ